MPAAAVLLLQAQEDGVLYGASGQHAHGFWLEQWRKINPQLGDALHDERPLRQFTISPLLGLGDTRRGRTPVKAGEIARLRLTTMDDQIQPAMLEEWLLQLPGTVRISGLPWQRQRVFRQQIDHPDAGDASYEDLRSRRKEAGHHPHRWQLTFQTPTAFHLDGERYLPLPLPEKAAGSWLDLWNAYAPAPLLSAGDTPKAFLQRLAAGLLISRFKLKTVSFRFRFGGKAVPQIGCVGDLTLDGRGLDPADRALFAALADFAFYCGTGHHTTMGMGQTRVSAVH